MTSRNSSLSFHSDWGENTLVIKLLVLAAAMLHHSLFSETGGFVEQKSHSVSAPVLESYTESISIAQNFYIICNSFQM